MCFECNRDYTPSYYKKHVFTVKHRENAKIYKASLARRGRSTEEKVKAWKIHVKTRMLTYLDKKAQNPCFPCKTAEEYYRKFKAHFPKMCAKTYLRNAEAYMVIKMRKAIDIVATNPERVCKCNAEEIVIPDVPMLDRIDLEITFDSIVDLKANLETIEEGIEHISCQDIENEEELTNALIAHVDDILNNYFEEKEEEESDFEPINLIDQFDKEVEFKSDIDYFIREMDEEDKEEVTFEQLEREIDEIGNELDDLLDIDQYELPALSSSNSDGDYEADIANQMYLDGDAEVEDYRGTYPQFEEEKEEMCPICMDPCTDRTVIGCGHGFCQKCLDTWYALKNTCPCCRAVINENKVEEDANFENEQNEIEIRGVLEEVYGPQDALWY